MTAAYDPHRDWRLEDRWRAEFTAAAAQIMTNGWVCTATDGETTFTYIDPDHADHELVRHYQSVCTVGYARGWMD